MLTLGKLIVRKDVDAIISELKERFEKIYKSITQIEYSIDEDDVLLYTLRVSENSLWVERDDVIIVRDMTDGKAKWGKKLIRVRKEKLVNFIMETF